MPVPVHSLHCTVCDNDFSTRRNWLCHLLQPEHQQKARLGFFQCDEHVMKQCTLVIFSSSCIASDNLLTHFSEGVDEKYGNIVTDFVWFPSRPRVGFLQFESSLKVEAVLSFNGRSGGNEVRINNQIFQVKKAMDFLTLEWRALFPAVADTGSRSDEHISEMTKSTSIFRNEDYQATPVEGNRKCLCRPVAITTLDRLKEDFRLLQKTLMISDEEFDQSENLMGKLIEVIALQFPQCQVQMFRSWCLKLWNWKTKPSCRIRGRRIYFFVTAESHRGFSSESDDHPKPKKVGIREFANLFETAEAKKILPELHISLNGTVFLHKPSRFSFSFYTHPALKLVVQTWRLLGYMCSFDARVKSVLMTIKYWTSRNNIRTCDVERKNTHDLGDRVELDWLAILFLCKKGVVPTPREVQQQPHESVMYDGFDIGFSEDPRFPNEWISKCKKVPGKTKGDFVISVLSLTLEFFQFLENNLCFDSFILNAKDGELIDRKQFNQCYEWSQARDLKRTCSLTRDEVKVVKTMASDSNGGGIHFLHPLHIKYPFPFIPDDGWNKCKADAGKTAEKLQNLLSNACNVQGASVLDSSLSLEKALNIMHDKVRKQKNLEG